MISWRDRGRGGKGLDMGAEGGPVGGNGDVSLPLGPGEWDEGLGIPLCVVCQNVSEPMKLHAVAPGGPPEGPRFIQYVENSANSKL